jgi:internalin A
VRLRRGDPGFILEDRPEGRTLVVTGEWTPAARAAIEQPDVEGVWLNYARGYAEPDLSFIEAWPIRRLLVIDRSLTDLEPLTRLGDSLEDLSVQAAPGAQVDLTALPQLRSLSGEWSAMEATIHAPEHLTEVVPLNFDGDDFSLFAVQPALQRIDLKAARRLEALTGIEHLPTLTSLKIALAPKLVDVDEVASAAPTLRSLQFESCRALDDLESLRGLSELRELWIADCGQIRTLAPLAALTRLERLSAWGATRIDDNDLSPLLTLPLKELRMRDRATYQPRVADVKARLGLADS